MRDTEIDEIVGRLVKLRWEIAELSLGDDAAYRENIYGQAQKKLQEAEFWLNDRKTRGAPEAG